MKPSGIAFFMLCGVLAISIAFVTSEAITHKEKLEKLKLTLAELKQKNEELDAKRAAVEADAKKVAEAMEKAVNATSNTTAIIEQIISNTIAVATNMIVPPPTNSLFNTNFYATSSNSMWFSTNVIKWQEYSAKVVTRYHVYEGLRLDQLHFCEGFVWWRQGNQKIFESGDIEIIATEIP